MASGAAIAGAPATVEEISGITDAATADALASTVASRAPARVVPGETLPFTAVVADPPANLRDVEVRVSLQPER